VIHAAGRDQLISPGALRAGSYDPRTGKEIWSVSYGQGFSNVPRPVFGAGLVFICTGFFEPAGLAVRPDGAGDVTDCGSRKLDLRALGYSTARFSDPTHPARGVAEGSGD
jgi:hypothetical protein